MRLPWKKPKPKRKWCLPATCEMCRRVCEHYWGEVGDNWACEGHYQIMQSNRMSWELKYLETQEALWEKVAELGIEQGKMTDEDRATVKILPEWHAAMNDPVYLDYKARKDKGVKWLKSNPEPKTVPTCHCGEEAAVHDEGKFFCEAHWPTQ